MNPSIFRQAAQIIRIKGHGKGGYTKPTGQVCTLGAISTAATGDPTPPEEIDAEMWAAIEFLSDRVPSNIVDADPIERIADWNDREATTPADVVAQLEAAANAAEEAMVQADVLAHRTFGSDESRWTTGQQRDYVLGIRTARTYGQEAA
jgi:hypothetical protein